MARYLNGITGAFTGRVGSVVGSSRNGVPYMKGAYKNRTTNVGEKELANRRKFAMAQAWLRPLVDIVRNGFKGYSQRSQGFIAAKSWLLKNAFEGKGNDLRINPALVKISTGELPLPSGLAISQLENGSLYFQWDPTMPNNGHLKDQISILAYDVERVSVNTIDYGRFRENGSEIFDPLLSLPVLLKGEFNFHVYAWFIAADRIHQSESVYLGVWKRSTVAT